MVETLRKYDLYSGSLTRVGLELWVNMNVKGLLFKTSLFNKSRQVSIECATGFHMRPGVNRLKPRTKKNLPTWGSYWGEGGRGSDIKYRRLHGKGKGEMLYGLKKIR